MSLFNKFFKKKEAAPLEENPLPWIATESNPWHVQLLDLRPITETMTSTSKDLRMAQMLFLITRKMALCFWDKHQ